MTTTPDYARIARLVRESSPLVLCLTNSVTITDCANALLSVGASPVMSGDPADAAALASLASALVINIGTVSEAQEIVMAAAHARARALGIPIILDPVGAGATPRRLAAAQRFMEGAAIVRGNASEILALEGAVGGQKGVDSSASGPIKAAWDAARRLAQRANLIVAVTGETDYATDGEREIRVEGSHVWLTAITGTGCLLSAITGACAGVLPKDPLTAAATALKLVAVAGERAAAALPVPGALGTLKTLLFDQLATLKPEEL